MQKRLKTRKKRLKNKFLNSLKKRRKRTLRGGFNRLPSLTREDRRKYTHFNPCNKDKFKYTFTRIFYDSYIDLPLIRHVIELYQRALQKEEKITWKKHEGLKPYINAINCIESSFSYLFDETINLKNFVAKITGVDKELYLLLSSRFKLFFIWCLNLIPKTSGVTFSNKILEKSTLVGDTVAGDTVVVEDTLECNLCDPLSHCTKGSKKPGKYCYNLSDSPGSFVIGELEDIYKSFKQFFSAAPITPEAPEAPEFFCLWSGEFSKLFLKTQTSNMHYLEGTKWCAEILEKNAIKLNKQLPNWKNNPRDDCGLKNFWGMGSCFYTMATFIRMQETNNFNICCFLDYAYKDYGDQFDQSVMSLIEIPMLFELWRQTDTPPINFLFVIFLYDSKEQNRVNIEIKKKIKIIYNANPKVEFLFPEDYPIKQNRTPTPPPKSKPTSTFGRRSSIVRGSPEPEPEYNVNLFVDVYDNDAVNKRIDENADVNFKNRWKQTKDKDKDKLIKTLKEQRTKKIETYFTNNIVIIETKIKEAVTATAAVAVENNRLKTMYFNMYTALSIITNRANYTEEGKLKLIAFKPIFDQYKSSDEEINIRSYISKLITLELKRFLLRNIHIKKKGGVYAVKTPKTPKTHQTMHSYETLPEIGQKGGGEDLENIFTNLTNISNLDSEILTLRDNLNDAMESMGVEWSSVEAEEAEAVEETNLAVINDTAVQDELDKYENPQITLPPSSTRSLSPISPFDRFTPPGIYSKTLIFPFR
jgi:hypothetical protein